MRKSKMRRRKFRPEFVEFIPENLKPGVLYISIEYSTASHLCPCGCGQKVITPIRPDQWTLTWDGETVSLSPSIGNWGFSCKSHYWIRENRIIWLKNRKDPNWIYTEEQMTCIYICNRLILWFNASLRIYYVFGSQWFSSPCWIQSVA